MSTRKRNQWERAYQRAVLAAPDLLKLVAYSTPSAFEWVVTMEGECGTETLRVQRTSHESAEHAKQLAEHAWCEWVADQMIPGRDVDREAHWPIQGAPVPIPVRHTPHAHKSRVALRRLANQTRKVA